MISQSIGDEIENQSVQVSIESVLTETYKVESRRNKNGKFKVYKCLCGRKHHSRHQIKAHKLQCQKRAYRQKQNRMLINEGEIIGDQNWQKILVPHQQIQSLKLRLSIVERNQLYSANHQSINSFDPYQKAKSMFEKCSGAISGIIINKLATSLEHAYRASIKIIQIQNFIIAAIIGKLQSLSFDDCIQILSDKLAKAHKLLIEQSGSKKVKTQKYNQRAFNFLSQFNQFQLGTQVQLFDQLIKLEPTQRKNVCRYFSKIRKVDPYFAKFPAIPKLYKQIPRGIMLSKTSIEEAALEVRDIYLLGNKVLACDMWLIITMGLRFHDLLRLFFRTQDRIVKFFKLKQQKNNNVCSRYVTTSLIQMIIESETSYPASQQRLRLAVKECLKRFGSSYGFKHRAITAILAALHRANPLGRMHARPEMTSKHYIDHNDEKFIDEAFKIGIKFSFSQSVRKKIDQRDIEIDLTNKSLTLNTVIRKCLGEITLDCQNSFKDRLLTSALDGNFKKQDINELNLNRKDLNQFNQISTISRNHQLELLSQRYPTIEEAISQLDPDLQIIDATEILVEEDGNDVDSQIIIDKLSTITQRKVGFYQFDSINSEPRVMLLSTDDMNEMGSLEQVSQVKEEIIISKNDKGYAISAKGIHVNSERLSAILARQKIKGPKYLHRSFAPNCLYCRLQGKCSKLRSIQSGINCPQCGWKQQYIGKVYPLVSSVLIECSNIDQVGGYRCVKLSNTKNNLLQTINNIYPGKTCNKIMYSYDFPKKFTTTFKRASPQFERQIRKCRKNIEKLPFSIKQSTIPGAGLGVFASEDIKANSLLLTYDGLIGTSFSIFDKESKNSLFQAGWVTSSKGNDRKCFEILIDGQEIVGPARFLNSSQRMLTANITASTVIFENEILIYFIANQDIKSGNELLFYYGNKYWQQIQVNLPRHQQQNSSDSEE